MIRKLFIVLTLIISTLPLSFIEVNATDYTTTSCDVNIYSFSVDLLSVDNGVVKYTSQGCYDLNGWYSAQDKFNALLTEGKKNIVIRYLKTDDTTFQSPLKIVKADRAMAYTQNYTYTVGDVSNGVASTIGIYHNTGLTSRYTYLDNQEPLVYYDTNKSVESNPARPSNLVSYIEINGAQGYIKLTGIDIIPFIYIENNILVPFYVKLSNNQPKQWYVRGDGRIGIFAAPTKYTVNSNKELSIIIDRATTVSGTLTFSKAPVWLPQGTYYSANGINFYSDLDLKTPIMDGDQIGSFYSYYNYLNLRTKTNYVGTELDSYLPFYDAANAKNYSVSIMKDQGSAFVNSQNTYGVNALLVYAMAVHESDYGISTIARTKNNLFGYGANDSNPGDAYYYESVAQSVDIHMGKQLRYYLDYNNSNLFYGSNYGNKGAGINTMYASDPYWSVKIAGHAYRIDRYLGFKDFNAYQMAILDPTVSNKLYKETSLTNTLYTINARAKNYPLTIKASHNDTYYTQSTNPIVNNALVTSTTSGLVPYNFDLSQAYINKNQVKLVNTPLTPITIISDTDELLLYVTNLEWQEEKIYIKGWAALKSSNMTLETTHKLKIINMDDSTETLLDLSIAVENYELNLGNGLDYSNAWYEGIIDVSTLADGNYRFEVLTKSGDTSGIASFNNTTVNAPRAELFVKDNIAYRFSFNNTRGMRYELSKETNLFVENQIPLLPTRFNSTAYITNFLIEENELGEDLLTLSGISYIKNVAAGLENNVSHKLLLLNSTGVQTIFELTSGTGIYDVSNSGYDYSNSWFYGTQMNINDLPNDTYRMFIITNTSEIIDIVEVRDILIKNTQTFRSTDKNYSLNTNTNVRRRYKLTISDIVVEE